jgi:hypothetical protein
VVCFKEEGKRKEMKEDIEFFLVGRDYNNKIWVKKTNLNLK